MQPPEQAIAIGADEALLVSSTGELLEGSASNVFVVRDGEVLTPPLSSRILPGVTRAIVLQLCAELGIPARECALQAAGLRQCESLFVTNSVQEILPVATLSVPIAAPLAQILIRNIDEIRTRPFVGVARAAETGRGSGRATP